MTMKRFLAACCVAMALIASAATPSFAQDDWPARHITMIVPFPAGGTTDIFGRLVADAIGKKFGQQVVVENRGGAGGNIGSAAAAQAEPDGYTILVGTVGTHAINQSLYSSMPFDPIADFTPLSRIATVPNLLVANPQRPFQTVQQLIDYAKANPGEVEYASSGNGTSIHLSGELFKTMAGVDMLHVPYKGSAPALTDLLGNQVAIMFDNLPSAIQHVRAGTLRAIAVTSAGRAAELPDVPTIAESGLDGYEATSWFGVFVTAGTPEPVVTKLNAAIVEALRDPAMVQKIKDLGGTPVPESPDDFAAFIKSEAAKWGEVVKASGARVD